jgi:hypothetical protein
VTLAAVMASLAVAVTLSASPAPDRLLLCRPIVDGDPGLARPDAVAQAARAFGQRFLDYGVVCDGFAEAARAARRAGLRHAISSSAEGRTAGSRYVLTLALAEEERPLARRELDVQPGADAAVPLQRTMEELLASISTSSAAPERSAAPWYLVGAGTAVLAAAAGFALVASSAAGDRDQAQVAGDATRYVQKDASWRRWRTASGIAAGAGVALVAAGVAWRFAF